MNPPLGTTIDEKRLERKNKALERILTNKKIKNISKLVSKKKRENLEKYIEKKDRVLRERRHNERTILREGKLFVPASHKIYFVVRLKGIHGLSPKVNKIFELLRLDRINSAIFLKINQSTTKLLQFVEPYVAYGFPSYSSIQTLIEKKGAIKTGKRGNWQKVSLTGDKMISNTFNNFGIHSRQELSEHLYSGGGYFKEINNILWPFKLRSPKKGYSKMPKNRHVIEGGAFGNWGTYINSLIGKMV